MNAIMDALAPLGVSDVEMPATVTECVGGQFRQAKK